MPRGHESSSRSKRLEKEMHKQFLEPQEAGMLKKTDLVSGFWQEKSKLYFGTNMEWPSVLLQNFAQEAVRMQDPSHTPVTRSSC